MGSQYWEISIGKSVVSTDVLIAETELEISLPSPLLPPYLPTKPVSLVWSGKHHTSLLYRYTHIERLVYPHQRLIVPPAFIR